MFPQSKMAAFQTYTKKHGIEHIVTGVNTASKVPNYGVSSCPYFTVFRVRMQENTDQK